MLGVKGVAGDGSEGGCFFGVDFGGCEPSWVGSDIAEGVVVVTRVCRDGGLP